VDGKIIIWNGRGLVVMRLVVINMATSAYHDDHGRFDNLYEMTSVMRRPKLQGP